MNHSDELQAPREIAFVFTNVSGHAELAAAFRPDVEVHLLDGTQDGLAQIASILAGRSGIGALHLVGHGESGRINLGSVVLDTAAVSAHAGTLGAIGAALAEDGDIHLYGCEVAAGAFGTQFVARLAQATGADIAASTDKTGGNGSGGNWTLEYGHGQVGTGVAFDAAAVSALNGLLAIPAAGLQDVTSSMGIGNFVPGFTLDISAGDRYVSSPEEGYDPLGIYIFSEADQTTANVEGTIIVEADHVNLGSFDLTGVNIFKYTEGGDINGAYNFTLTGFKPDGSTVVTTFRNEAGTTNFSIAPNYSAFTGIVKYTLQINSATLRTEYDPPQTIYPVSNWTFDSFTIANTHGPNVVTAFLGGSTLAAVQGGAGVSVSALLHVSDTDNYQTLTWSQQTAPSHGTLSFSGAIAAGGSSDITPGGSITYTPAAGYVGADSFTVRVYDGFQAVTKTISVNVAPARPSTPDLAGALDTGASSTDNITNNAFLTFTGTGAAGDSSSTVRVFVDANGNGSYDAGVDATGTATMSSGAWTVSNISTAGLADGSYNVYAYTTSSAATGSVVGGLSDPLSVRLDKTGPALTITSDRTALKAGETATVTFTFSEDPGASFVAGDIAVTGGTLGALSGSGTTRTATFTPGANASGVASITVAAGNYTDTAGNGGGAGATPSLAFDTQAPTVAISSDKSTLKAGELATITFTFSEDPGASFAWNGSAGDIAVSGGTLSAISGSGLTRTATFTPNPGSNGSASITVNGGTYTDAAGNGGAAGTTPSLTFDTLAPTVAITSSAAALKAGDTATITFSFSEDPGASFDAGDIIVSGGTLGALSGTGTSRTATFTPAADSTGTATISIAAGAYLDPAGNGGDAGASAGIAYDTQAPAAPSTPLLDAASDLGFSSSDALTSDRTPTLTGTAEDGATVTLYGSDGVTVIGTGIATGGSWSITTGELAAGSHSITARATDAAGNQGSVSTPLALTIDASAPTVAITSDVSVMRVGGTATITFTFSEDPGSSFAWDGTSGDIVVSGGTLGALSGDGAVRTALFTPTDGSSGTASITIAAGTYTDAAGNAGGAGATPLLEIDTSVPTLAITSDRTALKAGESAIITFTFSEDPGASFTDADIAVSGGVLGPLAGAGATRTAVFTPTAGTDNGSASISVGSGLYADLAGNTGGASAGPAITFDTLAPAASSAPDLVASADSGVSDSDNITSDATPTFSGTAEDGATVTLYSGATGIGSVVATGGSWTITADALADGSHSITAVVADAAGNVSPASAPVALTVDSAAPAMSITSDVAALKAGEVATITFTFDEDPGTSFGAEDIVASGGTLGPVSGSGPTRTATFTPTAGLNGGTASITVAAGTYTDVAGNGGGAGATPALVFDTLAPTLAITSDTPALKAGETATITFTFSEDPGASFSAADIAVSGGTLGAINGTGAVRTATFTPDPDTDGGVASIAVGGGSWTDTAGNGGGAVSAPSLVFDTRAPAAPAAPDLDAADDSGISDTDNLTLDATPTFSGTGEEGATVRLYDGAGEVGSALVSGGVWSIAASALGDGIHALTATVTDAAGNVSPASAALSVTVDTAAPTLAITSDVAALKAGEQATITFTFSEDPGATFGAGDIVVSGGTLGALAGSGLTRTATFTPAADNNSGTASITVSSGLYVDAAGNSGGAGATPSLVFDTLAPTLDISSDVATLKAGEVAVITFTFSEDPGASFALGDVEVTGGTLGPLAGSGLTRSATFTPAPDTNGGVATVAVASGAFSDAAGNGGAAGAAPVLSFDTLVPPASSMPDLAAGDDSGVSDTDNLTSAARPAFSGSAETGATVTLYDGATVIGATVASGGTWTITPASPLADGAHLLSAVVTDAAGNLSDASPALALTVDSGAPALAIGSAAAALKAGETSTITFTFSEDPGASFTSADIAVSGGTLGALSGTGLTRTATFTPEADSASGTASISVAAGSYVDAAGNAGGAGAMPALAFDTLAPTLAITSDVAALKAGETATITFTFSEDPGATFSDTDIVVSGGTLGALAGSGATRTATFTPAPATNGGSAVITVASGSYADAAGNGGAAGASPMLVFDTLAPAASPAPDLAAADDSGASDSDDITSAGTPVLTGSAEDGATVRLYDGAVLVGSAVATGGAWTITSTALAHGSHALATTVTDAAGNVSALSAALGLTVDTLAPTLAIGSDAAFLKAGETALVTFTFSEDPGASFGAADITVTGGSLGALSGTGNIRTAVFTPDAGASGAATISVAAGLYADVAGNTGSAAAAPALSFDTLAPTLAIDSDVAELKAGGSATVTFTFSEDPGASFTRDDVTVSGGTLGALSGSGLTRTATFTPAPDTNGGTASITVAAGAYTDAAGNAGGAAPAPVITFDTLAPTLSITSDVATLKEGETAAITFTFSEDPGASFTGSDVEVSGGTLGALSGSGNTRMATFTPAPGASGAASISVAGGSYADAAGNGGASGASPALSFDTLAPSLAITSSAAALGAGQSATITFSFSEDPGASFSLDDVTVGGGTLGPLSGDGNVRTATFTPAAGSTAPASISVAAGSYTDSAGNAGTAAAATLLIDTMAPAAPSVPRLSASSDSGFSDSDGVTAAQILAFTGTAEDGATVTLVDTSTGAVLGSGMAAGGAWSITCAGLAEGPASIAAIATDAVGNASPASAATTVRIDRTDPAAPSLSLVVDSGVAGDGLTSDGTVRVHGLASGGSWQFSTDGGGSWRAGSGSSLVLDSDGDYSVLARQTDIAGNTSRASAPLQVRVDSAGPAGTVALSDTTLTAGESATVTVTFNEAVTGLDASDLALSNATVGAFASSDGGRTWTAVLTPAAGVSAASNTIQVSNAGVADMAGNPGIGASAPVNYSVMTQGLGGAITISDVELKAGERAQVTIAFSEAVTGFTLADLVAENGVLSGLASADGGRTWTATLTPALAVTDTSNAITLDNTGVSTASGVPGQGVTTSGNYTVSTVRPTAVVTVDDRIMATGDTARVTFQFSEAVSGFDGSDVSVTGGTLSGLTAVDGGRTWTATLTAGASDNGKPSSLGFVKLDMTGVQNGAGNAGFGNILSTTFAVLPADTATTTVDGATAFTGQVTNPETGLAGSVIIVPTTSTDREDDPATPNTALADIPVGLPASGAPGNSLVVSLPAGAGLQAEGTLTPLSNSQALLDLVARIEERTDNGSTTQQEMSGAGSAFLGLIGAGNTVETRTIQLYAEPGAAPSQPIVVSGHPPAPGATAPALALVIDGSALPAGTAVQLDHVDFAAVVGELRVLGGAGRNHVVGDGGNQVIYLGDDDDTLAGGAGHDSIGSAGGDDHLDGGADDDLVAGGIGNDTVSGGSGDDIVTGGRSTTGSWDFFVSASGAITARHSGAVFTLGGSETVQGAELDAAVPELTFLGADAEHLVGVSLLYSALGRAPDTGGLSFWSRDGVSLADVAAGVMRSAEWGSTPLGQAGDEAFVRGMYLDLLGREVDAAGLGFWTAALAAGGAAQATRADVLMAVALSTEHRDGSLTVDGYQVGQAVLAGERGWFGGSGDDRLAGGSGSDQLVGGDGLDTAVFAGNRADYRILFGADDVVRVAHTATGDIDTIAGIELAEFGDGSIDLSFLDAGSDRVGAIGLLYQAVFDRAGDAAGLAWWLGLGASTNELAQYFTATAEFAARYGGMDDAAFVEALYANSGLDASAEGGAQAWVDFLGSHTRADLVAQWIAQDGVIAAQFGAGGIWLL